MKKFFDKVLPPNKKDVYFWFSFVIALIPLIYICLLQLFDYMMLNFGVLIVFSVFFISKFIKNLVVKKKIVFPKSIPFMILTLMFAWLFLGSIFSQYPLATWYGKIGDNHSETSIFQFIFYYVAAVCVLLMDKKNIKHLLYTILVVINIVILIQLFKLDFGHGFINKNHSGYYLSVSVSITIGLILFSKKIWEIIPLCVSLALHYTSMVLNNSIGPIIGLIAFFIIAFVYYLIHNKKMLIRLSSIILSCVAIFSFFDYVPKVKNLKNESAPVMTQIVDIGLVVLNKVNIISDERFNEIMDNKGGMTPGADGYERLDMWEKSLENMKEYPMFGIGVGSWAQYNPEFGYRAPHNELMEYGAIGGIPVLVFYLGVFIAAFIKFRKKHQEMNPLAFMAGGAVITYLIQSVFGNVMPFTAPVFYMMVGLLIKMIERDTKETDEAKEDLLEIEAKEEVESVQENSMETMNG